MPYVRKGYPTKYPPPRALTEAERKLAAENLGLVRKAASIAAWCMCHRRRGGNLCFQRQYYEEIVDGGWIGLCVGIQRYEPERGTKLSSFVYHWIRSGISMVIKDSAVRIGHKHYPLLFSQHNFSSRHYDRGEEVDQLDVFDCRQPQEDPEPQTELSVEMQVLLYMVLEKRWARMVEMTVVYGMTDAEVGKHFGVTKQRVNQIMKKAMEKLRASKGFLQALEASYKRRRLSLEDFKHSTVGQLIA